MYRYIYENIYVYIYRYCIYIYIKSLSRQGVTKRHWTGGMHRRARSHCTTRPSATSSSTLPRLRQVCMRPHPYLPPDGDVLPTCRAECV